jgi:hypothetical protein
MAEFVQYDTGEHQHDKGNALDSRLRPTLN